jgi:hypothetical protein
MPATRKRPTARRILTSERRELLVSQIAQRVTPESTDDHIDATIRLFVFGSHSYAQHMAFPYYVSNPALQTTKLTEGQLKRLYKDIRNEANVSTEAYDRAPAKG